MKKDIAERVNQLMLEYGAKLDESVRFVMENCSPEEFDIYRHAVGEILGTMLVDIMEPIYREHPDLTPEQLLPPPSDRT